MRKCSRCKRWEFDFIFFLCCVGDVSGKRMSITVAHAPSIVSPRPAMQERLVFSSR